MNIYMKSCCHGNVARLSFLFQVLSLDPGTQHQVAKLRRDLLQLIGVREFSSEAIYTSPGYSYVLPEVTVVTSCDVT